MESQRGAGGANPLQQGGRDDTLSALIQPVFNRQESIIVRLHLLFYNEKQRSSTSVKVWAGWPRFLLVSMLIGLICVATASAQKADSPANIPDVVAKVNGVEIASGAVKLELNRVLKRFGKPMNPKQKKEVIRGIIDKEVVRELVYQDGKTKNIEVDTVSVEKELQAIQKPYADEKEFEAALSRSSSKS